MSVVDFTIEFQCPWWTLLDHCFCDNQRDLAAKTILLHPKKDSGIIPALHNDKMGQSTNPTTNHGCCGCMNNHVCSVGCSLQVRTSSLLNRHLYSGTKLQRCRFPVHIHRCRWVGDAVNSPVDEWQPCPCSASHPDTLAFKSTVCICLADDGLSVSFEWKCCVRDRNKAFGTTSWNACVVVCLHCAVLYQKWGLSVMYQFDNGNFNVKSGFL